MVFDKMSEESRIIVTPAVCIDHDRKSYNIEVELPGVKKENVKLEVSEQTFCIEGSRDDVKLYGCYYLAHPIAVDKTVAKFENGLLEVAIPLAHSLERKTVQIE